jgi:phosphopantetheinyl transferase
MALYKTIIVNNSTKVLIWKIEEPLAVLQKDIELTENSRNRLQNMKSEIHQKGFLSIRHLLAKVKLNDFDLFYDEFGKPNLKNGKFISITHSFEFTAIILSDTTEVGIDIEKQREKILKIATKFTPVKEYRTLANTDAVIRKLTIVWGAKESLYKIYGKKKLRFLENIYVEDFSFDDAKTTARISYIDFFKDYNIEFLEFEGFTCVYGY